MTRIKNAHIGITWVGESRYTNGFDSVANMFLRGLKYHPDNVDPYGDWQEVAKELWFDAKFLLKRIEEQEVYILGTHKKYEMGIINLERKIELLCSAMAIKKTLKLRLKEIQIQ